MIGGEQLGSWRVLAVASNVPSLRRALRDVIADRGFDRDAVGLAMTEAVSNVVRHAYPDAAGPVTVTAEASPLELVVVVADEGTGTRSFTMRSESGLGIGLALIREVCLNVRVEPNSHGTTVTMRFASKATPNHDASATHQN